MGVRDGGDGVARDGAALQVHSGAVLDPQGSYLTKKIDNRQACNPIALYINADGS